MREKPTDRRETLERAVLDQAREGLRRLLSVRAARAPGLARVEDVSLPGPGGALRARYYEAEDAAGALLLYLHGGGFVVGDVETHDGLCSWLARGAGARLLSVEYRLAPEAAFPAQIDDARAAAAWALANAARFGAPVGALAFAGDSAGAYLAARLALEQNARAPGGARLMLLLYPLVHVEDSLWAEEELRNFRFLGRIAVQYIARSLGAADMPSLLDLDLALAPPAVIAGGGALDPVRADAAALAAALRAAGVSVTEKTYPALPHGGLNLTALPKGARDILLEVGALARAALRA